MPLPAPIADDPEPDIVGGVGASVVTTPSQAKQPSLDELSSSAQVVEQQAQDPTSEKKKEISNDRTAQEKKRVSELLLAENRKSTSIERLLVEVIAQEMPLVAVLEKAKADVAARLLPNIDNPKAVLHVAKVLREIVATSNAVTKRVEHLLGSLATLRSQQRLLEQHRAFHEK